MAEAWLRQIAAERGLNLEVESAGLEPGKLNPLAVEVMREVGIDISGAKTQSVWDLFRGGRIYSHVITVCDGASAERCPIFPGVCQRIHWSFEDPSSFEGTHEEKLAQTRVVRDQIKEKITEWLDAGMPA